MSDDNILLFPTDKIKRPIGKNDEAHTKVVREKKTKEFVEMSIDEIARHLLEDFVNMGVKTNTKNFLTDLALAVDCLRGLVYRDFEMPHPAQKLADRMVQLRTTLDGNVNAKLDYSLLGEHIKTKAFSPDTQQDINDSTSPINFEPDFDPSNDK